LSEALTMPRSRIRVLLADDHEMVRRGLLSLLGNCPDFEIVGEAQDGQMAVALARQLLPDVVLMDVLMPCMTGIEATEILRSEMPQVRVIGLSMHNEPEIGKAMLDAGAVGYLTKTDPPDVLMDAIRACMQADTTH
jgi:NarL family two-component system response regulator LiaR